MRTLRRVFTLSLLAATATVWANDEAAAKGQPGGLQAAASVAIPAKEAGTRGLPLPAIPFQAFSGESDEGPLYIYDWSIAAPVTTVPTPVVGGTRLSAGKFAISPDSRTLFVSDDQRSDQVMVFNNTIPRSFAGTLNAGGRTRALAAGPTGQFLYVAVGGFGGSPPVVAPNSLTVINLTGGAILSIPLDARPGAVAVTPNNSYVVVTFPAANKVAVINIGPTLATHTFRAYVPLSAAAGDLAISPDSKRAVVPGPGLVSNVDLTTLARTDWLTPACGPDSLAFSPAGTRLYLACVSENSYKIIHGATGAPIASGGFPPSPPSAGPFILPGRVSVTPDGKAAWFQGEPLPTYISLWVLDTATLTFPTSLSYPEHSSNKTVFGGPFYDLIDPMVTLTSFTGVREAAPAACAAGQFFKVTAKWKNSSTRAWSSVFAEVKTLTGGNILVSQTFDLTADGVVNPGEVFTGVFRIKLNSCAGFSFQVSLAATTDPAAGGPMFRSAASATVDGETALTQLEQGSKEDTDPWLLDPQ